MKKLIYLAVFLVASLSVIAKESPLDIEGVWNTGNNNSLVKIAINEGIMVGKLIKSDKAKAKLGTLILSDLKKQKRNWQATVYSIKRDKFFSAKVTRLGNKLLLNVDAGFFSKGIEWQLQE